MIQKKTLHRLKSSQVKKWFIWSANEWAVTVITNIPLTKNSQNNNEHLKKCSTSNKKN